MKKILLNNGTFTLVDDEDYEWLNQWKWNSSFSKTRNNYVCRWIRTAPNKGTTIQIHRIIMKAQKGQIVDHINGDILDNRKCNLRFCNHAQNRINSSINKNNSSGFRGVRWFSKHKRWGAQLHLNKKTVYLGMFKSKTKAAKEYDKAVIKYFGEFARTNFKVSI